MPPFIVSEPSPDATTQRRSGHAPFRLCAVLAAALLGWSVHATAAPASTTPAPVQLAQNTQGPIIFKPAGGPSEADSGALALEDVLRLAREQSYSMSVARAQAASVRAGIQTARAYPNPEFDVATGNVASRRNLGVSGTATLLSLSQPIENPALRRARIGAAELRAEGADTSVAVTQVNLTAQVKARFYDILQLQEQLKAFREDQTLTEQILERVKVRVRTGEGPRFDLVRAESEVEVARKNVEATRLLIDQAKAALRQIVGTGLPDSFEVRADLEGARYLTPDDYQRLRAAARETNPELRLVELQRRAAESQIEVERQTVLPAVGVRASTDVEPDIRQNLVGVFLNIPVWDRRQGPIAQARADAARARFAEEQRGFELARGFEGAWSEYQSALAQVRALEGGIIERARTTLEIAEAAYRFGERGILEFLDAQRQFRLVRNELIVARFNLQFARIELERLAGRP